MTRDEFKFDVVDGVDAAFYNKAIDVAFNYFESRVCKNCSYSKKVEQAYSLSTLTCMFGYGDKNEYGTIFTSPDFGCNKFESKLRGV